MARRLENSSDKPRCLLIADDLTGAADACVKFVTRGFSGAVLLSPDVDAEVVVDIQAINTDTRRLPEAEARRRVRATGRFAPPALARNAEPFAVFKKIDSTLRGHVGVEISEAMETFGRTHAIICPAFPAMGRTVRDGLLIVKEAAVGNVSARLLEQGIDATAVAGIGLRDLDSIAIAKAAMEAALARGAQALVCDAVSMRDLETIVSAASEAGGRPLWTGSAGLADALAMRLAADIVPGAARQRATSAGSVLLFVGSVHEMTRGQQTRLLRTREVALVHDVNLRAALDAGRHVLVPINVKEPDHVEWIERHILPALRDVRIAGLVMSGGDTAADVCDAFGAHALRLHGEVEQGVPWGALCGGVADRMPMVLKSGAFGTADTLVTCLDFLVSRHSDV